MVAAIAENLPYWGTHNDGLASPPAPTTACNPLASSGVPRRCALARNRQGVHLWSGGGEDMNWMQLIVGWKNIVRAVRITNPTIDYSISQCNLFILYCSGFCFWWCAVKRLQSSTTSSSQQTKLRFHPSICTMFLPSPNDISAFQLRPWLQW